MIKRIVVISAVIFICSNFTYAYAEKINPESISFIEVPKELYKRLKIPSGVAKVDTCSENRDCDNYFCPTLPKCKFLYEFQNLSVENIQSIEYKEPDLNELPYPVTQKAPVIKILRLDQDRT